MRLVATIPLAPLAPPAASPNARVLELFDAQGDAIYRLALLMLGRPDAAEDVVQETFLKVLQHVTAGGPLPNPRGWMFTVAAHACRDRQRAARRWLPWLPERDLRIAPDRPDAGDAMRPLLDALHHLSPRDRALVALRAEGLSYAEIAEAAGLRAASTGRILGRALERLARRLAPGDSR